MKNFPDYDESDFYETEIGGNAGIQGLGDGLDKRKLLLLFSPQISWILKRQTQGQVGVVCHGGNEI